MIDEQLAYPWSGRVYPLELRPARGVCAWHGPLRCTAPARIAVVSWRGPEPHCASHALARHADEVRQSVIRHLRHERRLEAAEIVRVMRRWDVS